MSTTLLTLDIAQEHDVVLARQRARQVAAELGLDGQEQIRFATAVSEIARNAYQYARGGRAEFAVDTGPPAMLLARVHDQGPGIARLGDVLEGQDRAANGLGLVGARRLTDRFDVHTEVGRGTTVTVGKTFPTHLRPHDDAVAHVAAALARTAGGDPLSELRQQNQELMRVLGELRDRQAENERLTAELAETNRGVLALYAELDERAGYLERLNDLKTRFLSDLNHEIRTPLNAVRNVARLLLDGYEGPLTERQRAAVELMRSSTGTLSELVNDWLDLAKIEAGKTDVRVTEFAVEDVLGALRAVFRPLDTDAAVALIFEEPPPIPPLSSDESKIAQILRNFVSNALKFTEHGEVRVSVHSGGEDTVSFAVSDTGIGIPAEHLERVFEEFSQIENPLQSRVKGTGLGLPLSRRLARLLGGEVTLRSEPGRGSTFTLIVPRRYADRRAADGFHPAGEATTP